MPKYLIAGLFVEIDAPREILHENLTFFETQSEHVDIQCNVVFCEQPKLLTEETTVLLNVPGTTIFEDPDYLHTFHDAADIPSYARISKDWSSYTIYINPTIYTLINRNDLPDIQEGIFIKLREFIISSLAQKKGVIVHSGTVLLNDEGVMFSAPSGGGKTTHTNIWRKTFGTPILNGDSTACRIINGKPRVYGIPWCGTSEEFINTSCGLRAIVFLQKGDQNNITQLGFQEAFIRLSARCFLFPLNELLMDQYLKTIELITKNTDCFLLHCLPNEEAVNMVKSCLEDQ